MSSVGFFWVLCFVFAIQICEVVNIFCISGHTGITGSERPAAPGSRCWARVAGGDGGSLAPVFALDD